MKMLIWIGAILFCTTSFMAHSQDAPPRVQVLQQLYDCRTITDPAERLACYDRQIGVLQSAENAHDIRVVDREQVRETRRGLFGISLGGIGNIFGGDDNEPDAVEQIEATLSTVGRNGLAKWVYTLDNGQVWVQTDGTSPGRSPHAGQHVVVRRSTFGSYIITVEGRPGIRVRRER
ncbi:MAG: hypothetical protein ABL909_05875 [Sphingopyxis sp.]